MMPKLDIQIAIEAEGWDGAWYRRGTFDDGTPLGSATSDECRIDSIDAGQLPQVLVFNKCDCLPEHQRPLHQRDVYELPSGRRCHRVFVSALKGEGLGVLREVLADAALHGLQGGLDAPPQRDPRFDMHNASHEPVPDAAPPEIPTDRS